MKSRKNSRKTNSSLSGIIVFLILGYGLLKILSSKDVLGFFGFLLFVLVIIGIASIVIANFNSKKLLGISSNIENIEWELGERVQQQFMVQPCFRCQESSMTLLGISPNGRSIEYKCTHCGRKMHSPASTSDAHSLIEPWNVFCGLIEEYNDKTLRFKLQKRFHLREKQLALTAASAPMPYEKTTRTPIPEALRGQIWRRDLGACVQCGSKQNLQYDHIIPVARGGATTFANLQLLCQSCNGSKGTKI